MTNDPLRGDKNDFAAVRPPEVQEWCWHMDLHLTEHDDRHAAMALRSAWPAVSKWLETVEGYWKSVVAALPVGKAAKWRGHYAHFYNGYWYVKRSAAEKEIAKCAPTAELLREEPNHLQDVPRVRRNTFTVPNPHEGAKPPRIEVVFSSFAACIEREVNQLRAIPSAELHRIDQAGLDAAAWELQRSFGREGSIYGIKACEEIARLAVATYQRTVAPTVGARSK